MSETYELVRKMYKDDEGEPLDLSLSQVKIFDAIFKKQYHRNHIMTSTQFGKTMTAALGVLTRIVTFPEKWVIVAPKTEKARIMMRQIIQHTFDNQYCMSRLQIGEGESIERIRRERSKNRLTYKTEGGIGEVFILSAEASRVKDVEEALMGYGAPHVIEDESALIPDRVHSTVMRMLGGHKDNYLYKIGNPFRRNHFLRSFRDPRYHQILVDWKTALDEGRLTREYIEEMKKEAFFDILYAIQFPEVEAVDERGYSPLITEKDLGYLDQVQIFGERRLGIDVAGGGGNKSVILERGENGARVLYSETQGDTMQVVAKALEYKKKLGLPAKNIFVDTVGYGQGVADRLDEQLESSVTQVNFGGKPEYEEKFANLKAQCYWRAAEWVKGPGKLERHQGFEEALDQKYKVQSDQVVKIMPKEDLFKEGILSPDHWDGLSLTFARSEKATKKQYTQPPYQPISRYEGRR